MRRSSEPDQAVSALARSAQRARQRLRERLAKQRHRRGLVAAARPQDVNGRAATRVARKDALELARLDERHEHGDRRESDPEAREEHGSHERELVRVDAPVHGDLFLAAGCAAAGAVFLALGLLITDIALVFVDPRALEGA